MPTLQVQVILGQSAVQTMVEDRLSGGHSRVHRDLAHKLIEECLKQGLIKFDTDIDPYTDTHRVSARMVVGQEHVVTHKMEALDYKDVDSIMQAL